MVSVIAMVSVEKRGLEWSGVRGGLGWLGNGLGRIDEWTVEA